MTEHLHGVNTITIAGEPYLLAGGDASHLVAEAENTKAGRPAIDPSHWELLQDWQASYDRSELESPRWSQRTLCGRTWSGMEPGDGPGFVPWSTPVYAPSCRTCLRVASARLESRPDDDRIPLVAALVVQEVVEHGETWVNEVPGDQAEALRTAIRRELRRHNLRGRTHHFEETVYVISDDAYEALPQQQKDAIHQQLTRALDWLSDEPGPLTRTGINWNTWGVT